MPFVLDESSFRIDKTVFPTKDEAKDRAAETSRILGRAITVYELVDRVLHFAFRVMPDGSVDVTNPTVDHQSMTPSSPAVLGKRQKPTASDILDVVANTLDRLGRDDLATIVDRENMKRNPDRTKRIAKALKARK